MHHYQTPFHLVELGQTLVPGQRALNSAFNAKRRTILPYRIVSIIETSMVLTILIVGSFFFYNTVGSDRTQSGEVGIHLTPEAGHGGPISTGGAE